MSTEDHVLTSDPAAERALLAGCMESKLARDEARKAVTGKDFYQPVHEDIWDAMSALDRAGTVVEPDTVRNALPPKLWPALVDIVTLPVAHVAVGEYARIVREFATRRRLDDLARNVLRDVFSPAAEPVGLAAHYATAFAAARDIGVTEDVEAVTLAELLAETDDEPDWLIPGLLERRDRFMLTGQEGLGKSYLLRQMAVMGAYGLHPFETVRIKPFSTTIIDVENSRSQVRRKVRPITEFASRAGTDKPGSVNVVCSTRMDITRDKDLARIHRELDATQPDVVVIGPLYRLAPRALQTDDEASPVLAALDTIRDRGMALLIEAHAGHAVGKGGERDFRPRGSSALMGWPEFGYGMKQIANGYADLVPWRGDRDVRSWPARIKHDHTGTRWIPVEWTDVSGAAS